MSPIKTFKSKMTLLKNTLILTAILLRLTTASPILTIPNSSLPTYDVLIIGGGPAGLSAASALGRVQRTALLIDSGVYRNAQTQEMHDVIGNDGTVPSTFRALARLQISAYPSVTMQNGTVTAIAPQQNNTYFTTADSSGQKYLSKKVILATGMKDLLPNTPGLAAGWGKGIYWCPWCDGWEHRSRPFANMGPFSASLIQSTIRDTTLNPSPLLLTNTTCSPPSISLATSTLPDWATRLSLYNISIDDRPIARFSRLHGNDSDHADDFVVTFADNGTVVLNAIHANFASELASDLPGKLGLAFKEDEGGDRYVGVSEKMESSVPGVFVVGDANSDGSHNVPHAMWSAKRAIVYMHGVLAKEYANALVETSQHSKRLVNAQDDFEAMKRGLAQPLAEHNSAEELIEYMKK